MAVDGSVTADPNPKMVGRARLERATNWLKANGI